MSTLFCCVLYRKEEFDREFALGVLRDASPAWRREGLHQISVTDEVEMLLYHAGASSYKSTNFSVGVEYFLLEGFLDELHELALDAGREFAFYGLLYSDMSTYEVAVKMTHRSFHGRALIDDEGERIDVFDEVVQEYQQESLFFDPEDFGAVGDDDSTFDDDAYFKALKQAEAAYSPLGYVEAELGIRFAQLVDALGRIKDEGVKLWPSPEALEGFVDNPGDPEPAVPTIPMWGYLTE